MVRSDGPWGGGGGRKGKGREGEGRGGEMGKEKKRKEERYEEGKKEKRKRWKSRGYLYPETSRPNGKINQENHWLIWFVCTELAAGSRILVDFELPIVFTPPNRTSVNGPSMNEFSGY